MSKYPSQSLQSAVESVEKLFREIQRSEVDGVTAAKALGYGGDNGAARTKLAALNTYGLIKRVRSLVSVSDMGIAIAHPLGDSRKAGLKEAALRPPLFQSLWKDHRQLSEKVLASTLVHQGFDQADAEQAAGLFKENIKFAELDMSAVNPPANPPESSRESSGKAPPRQEQGGINRKEDLLPPTNMLANYTIPLGANEAQLTFTGSNLEPADFDALIDYVNLFKKQFQRKQELQKKTATEALLDNEHLDDERDIMEKR
jgi:hypothetical protein